MVGQTQTYELPTMALYYAPVRMNLWYRNFAQTQNDLDRVTFDSSHARKKHYFMESLSPLLDTRSTVLATTYIN